MRRAFTSGIVLTPRDLLVLRTLVITRVLDSEQVRTIAGFLSVRRTNRRLLKLVQAGLLRRWFVGTESGGQRALYGLSPQGAAHIGESSRGLIHWKHDALITSSQFLAHQQAVNAVFIEARFKPLPRELFRGSGRTSKPRFPRRFRSSRMAISNRLQAVPCIPCFLKWTWELKPRPSGNGKSNCT